MKLVLVVIFISIEMASAQTKECTTPDLKPGTCVPLRDCQIILDLLGWLQKQIFGSFMSKDNLKDYISRSQCGYDDKQKKPLVCCQSWKTSNRATTTTVAPALPGTPSADNDSDIYDDVADRIDVTQSTKSVANHPNIALINGPECGSFYSDRIINGNRTGLYELPWMTLLQFQTNTGDLQFLCGGTLISPRYVLTAAHCLAGAGTSKLVSVRLGEHDLSSNPDCEDYGVEKVCAPPPQDIPVERVLVHRDFEKTTDGDDIALVRLAEEVTNKENINTICLPVTRELQSAPFDTLLVSGWGLTETSRVSDVLLKASLPAMSNDQCNELLKGKISTRFLTLIHPSQICAGGANADSAQGDSGGPLQKIVKLSPARSRYVQYGIVSFGYKPLSGEILPTVFTRVSSYMSWILDNMTQ